MGSAEGYWAMSTKMSQDEVLIPPGVTVRMDLDVLTIKGPLGQWSKDFSRIPITIRTEGGKVVLGILRERKRDLAVLGTVRSIIKKLFVGVTKGYTYRMKVAYAHFPISVKSKGDEVHVENFYGERSPRVARIVGNCKVTVEGDDVIVHGLSPEATGQTAANIEQATRIKRKDSRIFLDGVYVYEKGIVGGP